MVGENKGKKLTNPIIIEKDLASANGHKFSNKVMLRSNPANANLPITSQIINK